MNPMKTFRSGLALVAVAVLLVGCESSSVITFNAPASVSPQETFQATVTQEWQDPAEFDPNSDEQFELVFALLLPEGWTVGDTVEYVGTLGGAPLDLTLERQPGPLEDNFREWLEADGAPPQAIEEYDLFSCSAEPPDLPPGSVLTFFRATEPFPQGNVSLPEGGEFIMDITSGILGGSYSVAAAHGIYSTIDDDNGPDFPNPITSCLFFLEAFGDNGPPPINVVSAQIGQVGSASVPVPVGGVWGILVMALGLMATGVWFGRRRLGAVER